MIEKFKIILKFGETSLKSIIRYLYCIGCVVVIYKAFIWSKSIYLTNYYSKQISYLRDGQQWYTSETVNNLPLGILAFIFYFIVVSLIWKLLCELLYIIFERIARK